MTVMIKKFLENISDEIIDELNYSGNIIVDKWMQSQRVIDVLGSHRIKADFFRKHFAFRIYATLINIFKGTEQPTDIPIFHILLHFSAVKYIPLSDIFLIQSELKNIIVNEMLSKGLFENDRSLYRNITTVIDLSFAGVIERYFVQHSIQIETYESSMVVNQTENFEYDIPAEEVMDLDDRVKDIRYSKQERYDSETLIDMMDIALIDKIERFIDDLDELMVIFYDMEDADYEVSYQLMENAIISIRKFYALVDMLVVFPVIANTFKNLFLFLEQIQMDFYQNLELKHLLIQYMIGIIDDLEKWISVVFVKRIAHDVHYLDASFANNILEIEAICTQKAIVIHDEDDLEFF